MVEFLTWLARQPRTYGEVMEAWRSTCPRLCVWEDARAEGLVLVEHAARLDDSRVVVSPQGLAMLEDRCRQRVPEIRARSAAAPV
jgi:hypothetical protein